jgi:cobalt/nickel transport system ATP-binding protein
MAALEIRSLCYRYPDGTPALRDISLSAGTGEIVGLVGANGAGKSTLLLHLNGVLAAEGAVSIGGVPVTRAHLPEVRRRVGLVFQNPDDQLFMPRVCDDVAFGAINLGFPPAVVECKVRDALEAVGMTAFAERAPHHLSLGEKKKIAIATVLVMECEVLALDEPTAGLDPRARRDLMRLLATLPCTQVIATHDLEMAVELFDRVALLSRGERIAEGPPQTLLADEALMEAHGLEVPHSLRPHLGEEHHRRLRPFRNPAARTLDPPPLCR